MKKLAFALLMLTVLKVCAQQAEPLLFKEKIHDFGRVNESSGAVDYDFTFMNNAGRPIKILSVQASCGCTTPDWSKDVIQKGKSGFVKISFDPRGRPGYFNKSISVTTDLDTNPIILQIKGQVVTSTSAPSSQLKAEAGNLRLKSNSFNLGKIYINKDPSTVEFDVFNAGDKPITFKEVYQPKYMRAEAPTTLLPGQTSKIKITYDAKAKNQYGFVNDNVEWVTDDELSARKSFSVYATIEEYFPTLSPEELAKAPQLQPEVTLFDLGRTKLSGSVYKEVRLKNTGKKDLKIHAVQSNCSCLVPHAKELKIEPGTDHLLGITFTPQQRTGTQQKAVTLYTNDPRNPVQRITFTIYVED